MLNSKADFTKIKNTDNKTPLHFAIHNNKIEIMNLILNKLDISDIANSYIYLHKAIRIRDPSLTIKLIDLGVDPNQPDDQGKFLI
jgi:ankyrin repeat protein